MRIFIITCVLSINLSGEVSADERRLIRTFVDWDTFMLTTDAGEYVCYMVAVPKQKAPASINHGNPFITITHKPTRNIMNEINFTVGFEFKHGSEVKLKIDDRNQKSLFTSGDGAWAYDSEQDIATINTFRSSSMFTFEAEHSRGETVSYEFSLRGFAEAHDAINRACSPGGPQTGQMFEVLLEALTGSDDHFIFADIFLSASIKLIAERNCTVDDFVEIGGWLKSTNHPLQPIYFTYCGGMRLENKIYLNAATGELVN